jgi:hypothetical protein
MTLTIGAPSRASPGGRSVGSALAGGQQLAFSGARPGRLAMERAP